MRQTALAAAALLTLSALPAPAAYPLAEYLWGSSDGLKANQSIMVDPDGRRWVVSWVKDAPDRSDLDLYVEGTTGAAWLGTDERDGCLMLVVSTADRGWGIGKLQPLMPILVEDGEGNLRTEVVPRFGGNDLLSEKQKETWTNWLVCLFLAFVVVPIILSIPS